MEDAQMVSPPSGQHAYLYQPFPFPAPSTQTLLCCLNLRMLQCSMYFCALENYWHVLDDCYELSGVAAAPSRPTPTHALCQSPRESWRKKRLGEISMGLPRPASPSPATPPFSYGPHGPRKWPQPMGSRVYMGESLPRPRLRRCQDIPPRNGATAAYVR